jgi:hypothetical protein
MLHIGKICIFAFSSLMVFLGFPGIGVSENLEELRHEKLIEAIYSVQQVKDELRRVMDGLAKCGTGSCVNYHSERICELVGALDVKVNGKIVGKMSGWAEAKIAISDTDIELMKLILGQCKPTNYQFWNFESILHLGYSPSTEVGHFIQKTLGASPKKGDEVNTEDKTDK